MTSELAQHSDRQLSNMYSEGLTHQFYWKEFILRKYQQIWSKTYVQTVCPYVICKSEHFKNI